MSTIPDTQHSDSQDNGTTVPGLAVPDKYLRVYTSIPQPGLNNLTSPLYTGAVVGGGTVVNGMFFNRGSAGDYDAWESLGNPGWGWKDLLPYFKKSETFTPPSDEIQENFPGIISTDLAPHGTDGPVESSFSNYQYPVIRKETPRHYPVVFAKLRQAEPQDADPLCPQTTSSGAGIVLA